MTMQFQKAERKKAKARVAVCGPSGAGKTHSALLIAKGLGKKIAVVDTENGSAELEAGKPGIPEYDVLRLEPPFDPKKYIEAIKTAEAAGYDVIILDSISHAWDGSGGLLEKKEVVEKGMKNSWGAWRQISTEHTRFIEAMLQSNTHLVVTMRTKTEYVVEVENGKTKPKKIGMKPVQREGMDYEFTIVFDIDRESHIAFASKDRTSLFDGMTFIPTDKTGTKIREWLEGGVSDFTGIKIQIIKHAKVLGKEAKDADFKAWVKQQTNLELIDENLEEIESRLAVLVVEASEAPQSPQSDDTPTISPDDPTTPLNPPSAPAANKKEVEKAEIDNAVNKTAKDFGGEVVDESVPKDDLVDNLKTKATTSAGKKMAEAAQKAVSA